MNQKSFAITTAVLAIGLCGPLCAESTTELHVGAFSGNIGSARVQVCFSSYGSAQYYDLRHRAGIRLEPADLPEGVDAAEWMQNEFSRGNLELVEASGSFASATPPTGIWHLQYESDGWRGEWRDPANSKQLPIRLARIKGITTTDADSGECPSSFYAPLRDDLQITYADATFEGHAYRTLTTPAATAMALPEGALAAKAIHDAAIHWLKDQAVFGYECSAGNGSGSVALDRTLQPMVWTDDFLVQEDNLPETYCGGAHGNFEQNFVVWDLAKGQTIDTWSWIQDPSLEVTRSDDGEPHRSTFRELLNQRHPRNVADDQCAEFLDQMTIAPPYPSAEGLVFPTIFFHAMRVCGDAITLSWSDAAPHLSKAGKAALKRWTK